MNVRATESEMEKAEEVGHQQEENTLTPSVSEIVHDTKPRQHTESMALKLGTEGCDEYFISEIGTY